WAACNGCRWRHRLCGGARQLALSQRPAACGRRPHRRGACLRQERAGIPSKRSLKTGGRSVSEDERPGSRIIVNRRRPSSMRLSRYLLPILKENPAEAQIASHRLMLRAGMIRQGSAGIYSWLPLGLTVLRKIENIVREEQARAGAVELLMPTIQSADLWRESGRYDDYGKERLRFVDRHEREMLY